MNASYTDSKNESSFTEKTAAQFINGRVPCQEKIFPKNRLKGGDVTHVGYVADQGFQ